MAGRNELDHLRRMAEDALKHATLGSGSKVIDGVLTESLASLSGQLAIAEAIMYHAEVLRSMGTTSQPRVITNIVQNETQDWVPAQPIWSEQLEDYI